MSKDNLRVGIVGANWGLTHVEAWRRLPGVEVVAICTGHRDSAEAVARANNIPRAFWDAERMIADPAIDVIDLTLRPSIRTPMAAAALARGKHVIQPLPFAVDFVRGRSLAEAARTANVVAMVENLHRYEPTFRCAKEMIEHGFLGDICAIRAHVRTDILVNPPPNYVYEWITQANSGASVLRNYGAQLLHCLTWMFGSVEDVVGRNSISLRDLRFSDGSTKPNGTEDTASFLLRFASGAPAYINLCWCMPAADGFCLDVVGTDGRLLLTADRLGPQNAKLLSAGRHDTVLKPVEIPERLKMLVGTDLHEDRIAQTRGFPLSAMCHHMSEAIYTGNKSDAGPGFDEAIEVMRIVEAAYRSDSSATWVNVSSVQ
jgi:predicted dehydrogenase